MNEKPILGIIGGSGLYQFPLLKDTEMVSVTTPFGNPSAPFFIGRINDIKVAFLARHGIGHHISPSEINYRANIYGFKQLGVSKIISISACGSLREELAPGHIVIPDQIFDLTHKRERSFFGEGCVGHVSVADPFCPSLSQLLLDATQRMGGFAHKGGTYVSIEGPRFSTKAESHVYRQLNMSIVGMTAAPEVFLAREAEICYATMAHVTDYDVWHESPEPVTVEMVIATLQENTELAQKTIVELIGLIENKQQCTCADALKNAIITDPIVIPVKARQKLAIFLDKYRI